MRRFGQLAATVLPRQVSSRARLDSRALVGSVARTRAATRRGHEARGLRVRPTFFFPEVSIIMPRIILTSAFALVATIAASHACPTPMTTRASYYGPGFHGRLTASGRIFRQEELTAAHRSWGFGTKVRVTNLRNGRDVVVTITDRGPYVRGRGLDLSVGAARALGSTGRGVVPVRLDPLCSLESIKEQS